jgi:hypothetical protein
MTLVGFVLETELVDWALERWLVATPINSDARINDTATPAILHFEVFMAIRIDTELFHFVYAVL